MSWLLYKIIRGNYIFNFLNNILFYTYPLNYKNANFTFLNYYPHNTCLSKLQECWLTFLNYFSFNTLQLIPWIIFYKHKEYKKKM